MTLSQLRAHIAVQMQSLGFRLVSKSGGETFVRESVESLSGVVRAQCTSFGGVSWMLTIQASLSSEKFDELYRRLYCDHEVKFSPLAWLPMDDRGGESLGVFPVQLTAEGAELSMAFKQQLVQFVEGVILPWTRETCSLEDALRVTETHGRYDQIPVAKMLLGESPELVRAWATKSIPSHHLERDNILARLSAFGGNR
jgi:hypothetical protein